MNNLAIKEYIEAYKSEFESVNQLEIYKWKAVKHFQDNWDIEANNFNSMLTESLRLAKNLLASGQYFPKRMLLKNTQKTPEAIRQLFKKLFNEDNGITDRIEEFRENFKKINKSNFHDKNDYQDHRAVIVYLTLRFPDRYFFYKQRIFEEDRLLLRPSCR